MAGENAVLRELALNLQNATLHLALGIALRASLRAVT